MNGNVYMSEEKRRKRFCKWGVAEI